MRKTQHKSLTIFKLGVSVFTGKTYILKLKANAISRDRVTISIQVDVSQLIGMSAGTIKRILGNIRWSMKRSCRIGGTIHDIGRTLTHEKINIK